MLHVKTLEQAQWLLDNVVTEHPLYNDPNGCLRCYLLTCINAQKLDPKRYVYISAWAQNHEFGEEY